jgi:Ca-activated chloride channel homolog
LSLMARSKRRRRFRNCCSAVAFLFVCHLTGYSQAPKSSPPPPGLPAIAVQTQLVVVPVRVTDGSGDFVAGLTLDDFRVYENGHEQRVTLFQREDTPVTVGLVVDHSRSMGPKLAEVATAIVSFAQSSNPQDEMFVVDFNEHVLLELPGGKPFTHDPHELARAVSAVSARGLTALYDAVNEGLNHLQLAHGDKRALIIVSDGGDNASEHKYADVLALARQSQTVIYSIGLIDAFGEEEDPKVLQRLCNDTGGIAFFPGTGATVADVSARIARDLREQYTLGFVPDKTGNDHSFRKIEVKVSAPGHGKIRVQTRRGYFASETPAQPGKRAS